MIKNVLFDMDGVLCDFEKKVRENLLDFSEEDSLFDIPDDKFWAVIRNIPNFWESLEPIEGSKELFDYAYRKANVEILSAPSRHDMRCVRGKGDWVYNNLSEYSIPMNLVRAKNKKFFANSETILIDDLEKNVNDFRANGGHAILFKNAEQALEELESYLGE